MLWSRNFSIAEPSKFPDPRTKKTNLKNNVLFSCILFVWCSKHAIRRPWEPCWMVSVDREGEKGSLTTQHAGAGGGVGGGMPAAFPWRPPCPRQPSQPTPTPRLQDPPKEPGGPAQSNLVCSGFPARPLRNSKAAESRQPSLN